jgi:hypothetical protein
MGKFSVKEKTNRLVILSEAKDLALSILKVHRSKFPSEYE